MLYILCIRRQCIIATFSLTQVYWKGQHEKFLEGGKMSQHLELMAVGDNIEVWFSEREGRVEIRVAATSPASHKLEATKHMPCLPLPHRALFRAEMPLDACVRARCKPRPAVLRHSIRLSLVSVLASGEGTAGPLHVPGAGAVRTQRGARQLSAVQLHRRRHGHHAHLAGARPNRVLVKPRCYQKRSSGRWHACRPIWQHALMRQRSRHSLSCFFHVSGS